MTRTTTPTASDKAISTEKMRAHSSVRMEQPDKCDYGLVSGYRVSYVYYTSGATSILASYKSDYFTRDYVLVWTKQAKFDEADMFSAPFQHAMIHLPINSM